MKKTMAGFLAVALLGTAFCANAAKVLRVGSETTFPPFEFVNSSTGEFVGFEMDLIRAMGKQAGYDVQIQSMGFDGIIPAVLSGNIDVGASGFSVTPERKKRVLFTDPFYVSGLSILIKSEDADKIKSFDDLKGKRIGVQIGTTGAAKAKEVAGAKISTFNNAGEAIMDMRVGGSDAVINDRPVTAYILTQQPKLAGTTIHLPVNLSADDFAMVVRKDNKALANELNDALRAIKASGEFQAIYEKWFGKN